MQHNKRHTSTTTRQQKTRAYNVNYSEYITGIVNGVKLWKNANNWRDAWNRPMCLFLFLNSCVGCKLQTVEGIFRNDIAYLDCNIYY